MILAVVLSCQPANEVDRAQVPCHEEPLAPGEVYAGRSTCSEERFGTSGEGRSSDFLLLNSQIRAVVRHPVASVTQVGVGGGGIADFAPWGFSDRLHEAVPLIGGGGLRVDEMEIEDDRLTFSGIVVSLPDRWTPSEGTFGSFSWRVPADEPRVYLEGADGVYLHVAGEAEILSGQVVGPTLTYGHDGTVEDLGGALRIDGATFLLADRSRNAGDWLYPDGPVASGTAESDAVRVYDDAGDLVWGFVPASDGAFETHLPPGAASAAARASGMREGPPVPVGVDLVLQPGATGAIRVDLAWEGARRPVAASWSAEGREGWLLLPPEGGTVPTGPGEVTLRLEAGPDLVPIERVLDVADGETLRLGAGMRQAFDPGSYVLVALGRATDRSRTTRTSQAGAVERALGEGARLVVLSPEDDVAEGGGVSASWSSWIDVRAGSLTTSWVGWTIASWPWSATTDRAGHGAVSVRDDPLLAHSVAGGTRFSAVDRVWLDSVATVPFHERSEVPPDLVRLDGVEDLDPWLDWLDHGADLLPAGPLVWVPVDDPARMSGTDAEAALFRGRGVATTGPLLLLEAGGVGPGDVIGEVPHHLPGQPVAVEARGSVDWIALIADGEWLGPFDAPTVEVAVAFERYLVAVAGGADDWAVTAPVWRSPPPGDGGTLGPPAPWP